MLYQKAHIPKRPLMHYKIYTLLLLSDVVGFDNYGYNYMCYYSDAAKVLAIRTSQLKVYLQLMVENGLITNLKQYGSQRCKFTLSIPKAKQ